MSQQSVSAQSIKVYVSSTKGNDKWNGGEENPNYYLDSGPVKTLERARNIVRGLHLLKLKMPISVMIESGDYRLYNPLILTKEDSGSKLYPVRYLGYGKGGVNILGSVSISLQSDQALKTLSMGKSKLFVGNAPFDTIESFKVPEFDYSLFHKNSRLIVARSPNSGFYRVSHVYDSLKFSVDEKFSDYIEDDDLWGKGYWSFDWFDEDIPISKLNLLEDATSELTLLREPKYNGVKKNARFYLYNSFGMMDSPNEWYFNKTNRKIFLLMPESIQVSTLSVDWPVAPHILLMKDVSYVSFEKINFKYAVGDIVDAKNVNNVYFSNCGVMNGNAGGVFIDGFESGISHLELSNLGSFGISLTGGDRTNLKPARNYVKYSYIHDIGLLKKTYQPAVQLDGVGLSAIYNTIKNTPHSAIILRGNNNIIDHNNMYNALYETSDAGVIYMARDWTEQGNIISNNFFSQVQSSVENAFTNGVYLDDQASGTSIYGNVFYGVKNAIFVNGGSDNKIYNNIFLLSTPAIMLQNQHVPKSDNDYKSLKRQRLAKMPYKTSSVWLRSYPNLARIDLDGYGVPRRNEFRNNCFWRSLAYNMPNINDYIESLQFIGKTDIVDFDAMNHLEGSSKKEVYNGLKNNMRKFSNCVLNLKGLR